MNGEITANKARRFFEEMGEGWGETLNDIFSEDIVWWIPKGAAGDYAGEHRGKQHIIEMMLEAAEGAFVAGSRKNHILTEVADSNCAMFEIFMEGETTIGPRYENSYVFIFKFDESGDICELREHVDTHVARELFSNI